MVGLIAAVDHFEEGRGLKLATYAEYKIRGAILDGLRALDSAARLQRTRYKQILAARAAVEAKLLHAAGEEEIAVELGVTVAKYRRWLLETRSVPRADNEFMLVAEPAPGYSPEASAIKREHIQQLRLALGKLEPRLQRVIRLRYFEELPMFEVAARLGVSPGRITQLRDVALRSLRSALEKKHT